MATEYLDLDNIENALELPLEWRRYKKHAITSAARMHVPFKVYTSEGPLTCDDGYLCIDSRGYLYPVDAKEFETIYVEVEMDEELT